MRKVIHVIHDLTTGGAETLVKDYALLINKNKFNLKVICFYRRGSSYETLLEKNKVKVIYLSDYIKIDRTKNIFYKTIFTIKMFLVFKKIIKNENPNIIHSHLAINTLIKFSKPSKNTKLYHTVHNEPRILWRKNSIIRRIDFKSTKWLVKKYKMRFIVLHDDMRKEINQLFGVNDSIVLNNGIDFSRFDKICIKKTTIVRKELKIPQNAFVVGHIGRFMLQKNHDFLVEIFYKIHQKNNNAFLLMIGSGELKNTIECKLKNYNLENNYLILSNRLDIPDLLNAMDCFVFPSKYEGLGIVLIEAQKMNLPCFISDKVPKYAEISNLVTRFSLNKNEEQWANSIIKYKKPKKIVLNDEEWNMKNVINKLECIYMNEI